MFPALMSDMFGNDDPFRQSMRQMDQMMNSVFGGGMPGPMGGMMMPFGGGMFDHFGSMMPMMNNQMNMMNNGHSQSFSSTTFMSYSSNGPNGQPQVYKESTSTRTGPGGIRETKKSVSDSRSGVKKMAIGHHIGDRGHIIERQQNVYSGEREENQELINLDDNEAEEFNNEWRKKAQNLNTHRNRYLPYTSNGDVLAIEGPSEHVKKRSSKQRSSKKSYKPTNDQ
ncbi:myeloid leukemia factor 2-like isoform X2 [Daktulosphaira vitifoliae]|uniref:myeloid leukemia factor 2-like isoform X2 n=1 Tax=Daktulosphaira vitifoliae TaxID=58002 RepID=UPI0021AABE6E|nr:myeloid leukemia factor 2-like isoform X2 [Daktulosphaira vitifoliae]